MMPPLSPDSMTMYKIFLSKRKDPGSFEAFMTDEVVAAIANKPKQDGKITAIELLKDGHAGHTNEYIWILGRKWRCSRLI
ncbi:MAG: hypothetical protein ABIX01_10430 [Chitinophagaceae bacterium]